MATAPGTLMWLARQWEAAIPGATFSGIVGDSAHGYGYHRSFNEVAGRGDYSCKLPGDRNGIDPNAACAIDMSHTPAMQREITRRFYVSWQSSTDLRLNHTREVIGSLDSRSVIYMDTQSGQRGSADNSHLWHVHVGGLRSAMITQHAVNAILSIVRGESWEQYAAAHPDDPFVGGKVPAPTPAPRPTGVPGPAYMAWPGRYLRLNGRPTRAYMSGNDVLHYQLRMAARGWDLGPSGADMAFSPQMDTITRQFQREKGLTVDGIVGAQTWEKAERSPVA